MSKYLAIAKSSMKETFVFRFSFFLKFLNEIISIVIIYCLWNAIFKESGQFILGGYTFSQMIMYIMFVGITNLVVMNFNSFELIKKDYKTGMIATHFIHPYYYKTYLFSKCLGKLLITIIICFLTYGVILLFCHNIFIPITVTQIFGYFIMLFFGILISFIYYYILGLCIYITKGGVSALLTVENIMQKTLSGKVIPLSLLPGFLKTINLFLPFQYVTYLPVMALLNPNYHIINGVLSQISMLMILLIVSQLLWRHVRKRADIYGG